MYTTIKPMTNTKNGKTQQGKRGCVYICMLLLRSAHCLKPLQSFAPLIAFQANSYQVVAVAIMTQLAPKLLINIRREYYQMRLAERTDLSWMINGTGAAS